MLALVASVMGAAGCGEHPSSTYATYADAVAAGSVARGWIPVWVPVEAVNIREIHDLDTNEVCIRFELPNAARVALLEPMHKLPAEGIEVLPASCSLRPGWWFEGLIQQQPANDGALYADVFEAAGASTDAALLVAADSRGPSIYIWSR